MSTLFRRALEFTLAYEGGYVDHPSDPGGATNLGVTQAVYDDWRTSRGLTTRSVRLIERSEAEEIYFHRYWIPSGAAELSAPVAVVVFDAAVNSGLSRALRWFADADGDWREMIARRMEFLTSLSTWSSFGRGWTRRCSALLLFATSLAGRLEHDANRRLLLVFDESGDEIARLPYTDHDLLFRLTRDRAYLRPDT